MAKTWRANDRQGKKINKNNVRMKLFLKYLIQNIVQKPEAVKIEKREEKETTIFLIDVDEADRGRIIGKQGKVIISLRNLLNVKAQKVGKKAQISLNF